MNRSQFTRTALLAASLCILGALQPLSAQAHGTTVGDLRINHPHAAPSMGAKNGGVFLRSIQNTGDKADRLVAASSPVATSMELHRMSMDGDVMRMREIPAIEVPPKSEVAMQRGSPNGYHLMLMGLKQPLVQGDKFPVILRFERAGEVTVEVWVESLHETGGHSH